MCFECYERYGNPTVDNPVVREAARAIDAVYEFSFVGGNLHIVVDDWNLDDDDLEFCRSSIAENVHDASADQLKAESYCLGLLESLDADGRASALAIRDRFWEPTSP